MRSNQKMDEVKGIASDNCSNKKRGSGFRLGGLISRGSNSNRQSLTFCSEQPQKTFSFGSISGRNRRFHSDTDTCQDSSGECSNSDRSLPPRSILRTSINRDLIFTKNTKNVPKSVSFGPKRTPPVNVRVVEPLFPYACDLWWTKEEVYENKQHQSDFTGSSDAAKDLARLYLRGVHNGRKQIRDAQELHAQEQDLNKTDRTSPVNISISTENFKGLVKGRLHGLAGLEMYMDKRDDVRIITKQVVQKYSDRRAERVNNHLAAFDTAEQYENDFDDIEFYTHVRSLTASDRSWAFVIGRADMEAAKNMTSDLIE